jgi:predicted nucleotidyltransferase
VSLPAAVRVLAALDAALSARHRRWYVFGAQAVLAYGVPRLTADVDVLIELNDACARDVVAELVPAGFELRLELSADQLTTARLLPLTHGPTSMPVDAVLASAPLQREFLERARRVDLGGAVVPVVSAEDLVAQKILAGRRKDLDDVRGVLARQGDALDLARVRDVLERLEAATRDGRLLGRLARAVKSARRS